MADLVSPFLRFSNFSPSVPPVHVTFDEDLRWDGISRRDILESYCISRRGLAFFRAIAFTYLFFINLMSVLTWEEFWLVLDDEKWYYHFAYFTNWTLIAECAYFALVAYDGFRQTSDLCSKLFCVSLVLQEIALLNSFLVTVVYWPALYNPERCSSSKCFFLQLNVHGVASLLILIDMLLLKIRYPSRHVIFVASFGFTYHLFATFHWAITGSWIYDFLDWSNPAWLLVYIIFSALFFFFTRIQNLQNWMLKKKENTDMLNKSQST